MKPISSFFTPTPDWSKIQPQISRWGKRSYSVTGYTERVTLNQIVKIYKSQGESFDKAAVAREIRDLDDRGKQKISELPKTHRVCRIFHVIRSTVGNFFFHREKVLQQWEKNVLPPFLLNPPTFSPTIAALRGKIDSFDPKGKYPKELWALKNHIFSQILGLNPVDAGVDYENIKIDLINENREKCLHSLQQHLSYAESIRKKDTVGENMKEALDEWIQGVKQICGTLQQPLNQNRLDKMEQSWHSLALNLLEALENDDVNQEIADFIEAASQFTVEAGNTPENRQFAMRSIIQKFRDVMSHRGYDNGVGSGDASRVLQELIRKYFFVSDDKADSPWNKNIISKDVSISDIEGNTLVTQIVDGRGHFINMIYIDGKQIPCDNICDDPWSSDWDGQKICKIFVQNKKLKELGNVIDQRKFVVPSWGNSNCYLSSAWINFAISLEYNRRLNALEKQG